MFLLVKKNSYRIYTYFCQNRPFRTGLFRKCTRVCLYTKNISKILTKWQPSQTFGHMQQTQRKKESFTNIFAISTAFIKKHAIFS